MIKVGPIPAAATAGEDEHSWEEERCADLRQIFISYGDYIDGIQFQYVRDGNLVLSELHGVMGDSNFIAVKLKSPSEYLMGLKVSRGHCKGSCRVSSLIFITNEGELGPYGSGQNEKVSKISLGEDRQFGGFHGRADRAGLTAIGVYLEPCTVNRDQPANSSSEEIASTNIA